MWEHEYDNDDHYNNYDDHDVHALIMFTIKEYHNDDDDDFLYVGKARWMHIEGFKEPCDWQEIPNDGHRTYAHDDGDDDDDDDDDKILTIDWSGAHGSGYVWFTRDIHQSNFICKSLSMVTSGNLPHCSTLFFC